LGFISIRSLNNITFENNCRIFVDGANPSFIRLLKARIVGEDANYESTITHLKSSYGVNYGLHSLVHNMFVIPIHFSKKHKNMLAHTRRLLDYGSGAIATHANRHGKLITALRTAVEKGDGSLDKEATSYDDCLDAFRMSLQY
jgi:hypothetical protein